jgi:hypothetical protein
MVLEIKQNLCLNFFCLSFPDSVPATIAQANPLGDDLHRTKDAQQQAGTKSHLNSCISFVRYTLSKNFAPIGATTALFHRHN